METAKLILKNLFIAYLLIVGFLAFPFAYLFESGNEGYAMVLAAIYPFIFFPPLFLSVGSIIIDFIERKFPSRITIGISIHLLLLLSISLSYYNGRLYFIGLAMVSIILIYSVAFEPK